MTCLGYIQERIDQFQVLLTPLPSSSSFSLQWEWASLQKLNRTVNKRQDYIAIITGTEPETRTLVKQKWNRLSTNTLFAVYKQTHTSSWTNMVILVTRIPPECLPAPNIDKDKESSRSCRYSLRLFATIIINHEHGQSFVILFPTTSKFLQLI